MNNIIETKELTLIQIKRNQLKEISQQAKDIRKGLIAKAEEENNEKDLFLYTGCTLNYIILNFIYNKKGETEFNTFNEWLKKGKVVNKGEKAFIIWGKPVNKKQEESENHEDAEYSMFPLCFVFSDKQVKERGEYEKN